MRPNYIIIRQKNKKQKSLKSVGIGHCKLHRK